MSPSLKGLVPSSPPQCFHRNDHQKATLPRSHESTLAICKSISVFPWLLSRVAILHLLQPLPARMCKSLIGTYLQYVLPKLAESPRPHRAEVANLPHCWSYTSCTEGPSKSSTSELLQGQTPWLKRSLEWKYCFSNPVEHHPLLASPDRTRNKLLFQRKMSTRWWTCHKGKQHDIRTNGHLLNGRMNKSPWQGTAMFLQRF